MLEKKRFSDKAAADRKKLFASPTQGELYYYYFIIILYTKKEK